MTIHIHGMQSSCGDCYVHWDSTFQATGKKLIPWLQNGCHTISVRHVCGIYEHKILKEKHSPIKSLLKMVRYNPQATKTSGQEDIILFVTDQFHNFTLSAKYNCSAFHAFSTCFWVYLGLQYVDNKTWAFATNSALLGNAAIRAFASPSVKWLRSWSLFTP
jgi:hypothetical protein